MRETIERLGVVLAWLAGSAGVAVGQVPITPANPVWLPLKVVATTPAAEAVGFDRSGEVSVTFNLPINPAMLSAKTFAVMGRWSGPVPGQFALSNGNRTVTFVRERGYSAGEMVTVSISKGLLGRFGGFEDRGHAFTFWAKADPGPLVFVKTGTLVPGLTPYGAFGGDLDDDGDLDLAVPNEDSSDVSVFLNDGGEVYAGPTNFAVGFHCSPSEGMDFDGDGVVDLAISNILNNNVSVLIGNGDGTFQPQVLYPVGGQPRGLVAFDVDADGDVDLVTANRTGNHLSLLRNNGNGTFAPAVAIEAGVSGETGVAAADMNRDGILDLVVAGYSSGNVAVMLGDGKGGFATAAVRACGSGPWMLAVGDASGDGRPDVGVVCASSDTAGVMLGDGAGGLGAYVGNAAGDFPIAIDLADADGDGDLDMSTSSFGSGVFTIHRNIGGGLFMQAQQIPVPGAGSCTVWHDRDGDGVLDLTGIDEVDDSVFLYKQ